MKSRRVARKITSKYHDVKAEIAATSSLEEKKELEGKLNEMGGIDAYQQASIISTAHFKTSRWIVKTLTELGKKPEKGHKLRSLEIGAINIQLSQTPWLCNRAIDINSQHPQIEECNFFDVEPRHDYDVVVCSMVINCVESACKRGEMIARLACLLKEETGILFLILPKRCVESPHIGGYSVFEDLLHGFGYTQLTEKRITPKVVFYVCKIRALSGHRYVEKDIQDDSDTKTDESASTDKLAAKSGSATSATSTTSGFVDWREECRQRVSMFMKKGTKKKFLTNENNSQRDQGVGLDRKTDTNSAGSSADANNLIGEITSGSHHFTISIASFVSA